MYWISILVLLIYLVLVWFLGKFMPLHGADVWILRGALAFLGLIGVAVALWYQRSVKKAKEESGEEEDTGETDTEDIDSLVREAVRRLKQSTLGRGTDLSRLPLVFVMGDSGSTKTTVLLHSALDPELLAGQVYRDTEVLPTTTANIWYTRQAIFVDPAGELMGQARRWNRLVKLLKPARFSAAIGKRSQAPRAAVVCFDTESFLQPGAGEVSISAARRLSVRLQEISQSLGISFPVYVLFTRVDRVSFFTEFVREMTKDEVAEVLGATLPLRSLSSGVYADEETRRLTKAFDELFYSLAERRIQLLPREHENEKLPAIYEFPREINKLRTLLVQFLVDLVRPSHLGTNPFLRGFYFTGVRPIVVDDVVAARSVAIESEETDLNANATQIFRGGVASYLQQAPAAVRSGGPRRMPQWCFLTSLFNDVLVKDRVALATSGSSSRVNMLRRIVLGTALLALLVGLTGFSISFFRNRALENRIQENISDLSALQTGTGQAAVLSDLQKLDRLRNELVTLSDYEENGPPLSMRWGLYVGDRVYREARPVYFDRFQRLLFTESLKRIVDRLSALQGQSAANAPNDAYEKAYNELKAYLITTEPTDHDKSTKEFLTPVLMTHWVADRDIDKDRKDLAALQFDFYATVLAKEIPFSNGSSRMLIDQSRAYLQQFAGINRYYVQLLAKASQNNRDLSFNEQYPESKGIIASEHKVKAAFTRTGYQFVQDALKNPATYMLGEEWVVGKTSAQDMDPAVLRQKLTERYNQDFIAEWNTVIKTSAFTGYANYPDGDKKLERLTAPTSPLLLLLYFISHNTDIAPAELKTPFAPVAAVEPPGPADKPPDRYISKQTESYIKALSKLQSDFHNLADNASDQTALASAAGSAGAASTEVTTIITAVPVDAQFANQEQVRRLLEEPIKAADALLKRGPIDVANGSGKGYCTQFGAVSTKYPFDPNSTQDASLDQLYSVFGATGDAWKKLNDDVKSLVLKVGSRYVPNPSATVKPTDSFLRFMNKVQGVSEALYPNGSAPPHLSYTLKQLPSNFEGVEVKIGSETLSGEGAQKTFVWSGAPEDIFVTSKGGDTLDSFNGPWAVFKFVARAHYLGGGKLEWVNETNGRPVMLPNGKQKSYDYQLQVSGPVNPFFDLQGMKCVGLVAGH